MTRRIEMQNDTKGDEGVFNDDEDGFNDDEDGFIDDVFIDEDFFNDEEVGFGADFDGDAFSIMSLSDEDEEDGEY